MKTFKTIKIVALSFFALFLFSAASRAATFTAVASGNWSSSTVWNGTPPSTTNTGDAVVIPSGITVTMDNNVTVNGALASLTVNGTLTGSSSTYLTITLGTFSGAGSIATGYVVLGQAAVLGFTGTITTDNLASQALSLKSAAKIIVNNKLTLAAGTLSVESGGSLTLSNAVTLVMAGGQIVANGGSLVLTNAYNVEYDASGSTGAELGGSGLTNVTINVVNNGTATLSNDLSVKGTLTLASGILALGGHSLTVTGDIASGGTGTISSTSASNITINTSGNVSGSLNFSGSANTVNNLVVTVGSANHAQINGTLTVAGSLTLNSGALILGTGSNLILKGDIANGGSGTISAAPSANINVNTSNSPSGALSFTTGASTINDLNINITNNGNLKLGSNLTVTGIVNLTNGHINIGSNNLIIGSSGSITGGNGSNYIITGAGGYVVMALVSGSAAVTYPVGTSTYYFPATAALNSGSTSGNISVNVMPHVYGQGSTGTLISATQGVVDATWDYKTDIATNLNMNIGVMWSTSAEVNGFDRTHAYISHYTNGHWDAAAPSAATSSTATFYAITRANITSLSPFAVFDKNTNAGIETASGKGNVFGLYPNPATDMIYITAAPNAVGNYYVEISNMEGQITGTYKVDGLTPVSIANLKNGLYFVKVYGNNGSVIQKFIKM
jgi:hypothetical protein